MDASVNREAMPILNNPQRYSKNNRLSMYENGNLKSSARDVNNYTSRNNESTDRTPNNLMKKIENDPKKPKYLQTIRGSGYVLWIK